MRRNGVWCAAVGLLAILVTGTFRPACSQQLRQRGLVRVRDEPRLRINAGGHTAAVQALAFTPDSKRLCSAGLDKQVQVWNLAAIRRNLQRVFLRERTLRWQVARGLRGSIYALASAPHDGLLAVGGYGAMVSLGDILLVDPVDGSLVRVLQGHRQTVCCLSWSADGTQLASVDTAGGAILWRRGRWQPIVLYERDRQTYGPETSALIAGQPKLRRIAVAGNTHVIVPVCVGADSDKRPRWKLMRVNLSDRRDALALDTVHHGMVSALAASRDGRLLASADLGGNLYLWDLGRDPPGVQRLEPRATVVSLSFAPDGQHLVAGTAVAAPQRKAQLQVWNVRTQALVGKRTLPDHVLSCTVSPDGKRIAYSGGHDNEVFCLGGPNETFVEALRAGGVPVSLQGSARRILKVAFAAAEPFYRVAFGTATRERGYNNYAELEKTFDTDRLQLDTTTPIDATDWLPSDWRHGDWTARQQPNGTLQLYRGGIPQGVVAVAAQLPALHEGRVRCHCWLADDRGRPVAIAVGTDVQNSIYVCRLAEKGTCPILRHFRGHHDFVTSVGVSGDGKYLVSGSADGTIRLWSLKDYARGAEPLGKWGATFEVRAGQLVARTVSPAGPLFRKGLRADDAIAEIGWTVGNALQKETRPGAIAQRLNTLAWGTQVTFTYAHGGKTQKPFQLLPAWQPLGTLFVDAKREWAFWTPEGYYVASMNGHRLFGWQINRGLHSLPLFYRADQFRKRLERTDLMRQLLPAGSLHEAFSRARMKPRPRPEEDLRRQIAVTPVVTILSPKPGQELALRENVARVTAKISVPGECRLVSARVFANGVVSTRQKLIDTQEIDGRTELTYEWEVPVPNDQRNLIQVVAGTDAETTGLRQVVVSRPPAPAPRRAPKLYVLAMGLNKYHDPEIQPLQYSVADAKAVVDALRSSAGGIYEHGQTTLLTGERATPESWRSTLRQLSNKLKETALPDDLLILFLAGHGIRAQQGESEKYYYIGYHARLEDVLHTEVYKDCISWEDFRILADVPCRKLAILDTCHSGAVQAVGGGNLKAAVRALQEDVILTVTAAEGGEMAAEDPHSKHGVFTRCLLEALAGKADASADGVVTLDEMVSYVKRQVPKVTDELSGGGRGQHPTATPDELLPYISLPLTRAGKALSGPDGRHQRAKMALTR